MKREDEINIKITVKTLQRMYTYSGCIMVLLPFLVLVSLSVQLKIYNDNFVWSWSNQVASE